MKTIHLAIALANLKGRSFFVKCEPEILDFTNQKEKSEIVIYSATSEFRLNLDTKSLMDSLGLLNEIIFYNPEAFIIGWNLKNLASYLYHYTHKLIEYDCKIIDLKIIEAFLGIKGSCPVNLQEAQERTKKVFADELFPQAKTIYQKIHMPLIFNTMPSIENNGIFNKQTRQRLYSYYEIEGQHHGRLGSCKAFKYSFLPQTIGPEEKNVYVAPDEEHFLYIDYNNMEISVLQWLSQDDHLGQILDLEEDLYKVIFKLITGKDCDNENKRNLCKSFMIGIIYGQSANSLSNSHQIALDSAETIVKRIHGLFPQAMNWLHSMQNKGHTISDYFGRRRTFEKDEYKIRNFVVQSPSAIICLDKLINLHSKIELAKICFYVHDGYIFSVKKSFIKSLAILAKDILESQSDFYPGLRLKSSCKAGKNLNDLNYIEM